MPFEDLVHAGVLGLIDAVRKYNPNKNASLKSFASFRIRGAILDSLRALDWGSRPLRKKGRSVAESISRLSNKLGRQPTEDEIARTLRWKFPNSRISCAVSMASHRRPDGWFAL